MITLVLICYAIYTAVMYGLMTLCLYCCPGKRVSRYLGDLHASGLIVGLNCRSPDQKHPVKIKHSSSSSSSSCIQTIGSGGSEGTEHITFHHQRTELILLSHI